MGGVTSPAGSRSTTGPRPSVEVLESLQREGYLQGIQEHQQQHLALFQEGFSSEKTDLLVFLRRTCILFFFGLLFFIIYLFLMLAEEAERIHQQLIWRIQAASVGDGDILAPRPSHTSKVFIEEAGSSSLTPGTTHTPPPHTHTSELASEV